MHKPLMLMAAATISPLLADDCCKPCCVPQPRAPINCECYTPAFYDMQCNWGMFVTVDFLYWYGRENGLSYASEVETSALVASTPPTVAVASGKTKYFDAPWEPGVRVGLGWEMCDGWDLFADWTYYHANKHHSASVTPFQAVPLVGGKALVLPWTDIGVVSGGGVTLFESVSSKWTHTFNQVDLELGRRYWLSKCFTMRPYAGLRGAWTNTHFDTDATANQTRSDAIITALTEDKFHNHNWGVGLLAGFQPAFYFTDEFSLFANADFGLLWGQIKGNVHREYVITASTGLVENFSSSPHNAFYGMQSVLDLALGLRWETSWCENRYAFSLDAGWEHHVWLNYQHRVKATQPVAITGSGLITDFNFAAFSGDYQEVETDLAMGGFVLRARFDF